MKVVVALDSFKESMSATCACLSVKEALSDFATVIMSPMADGGEGTLETLVSAMNGTTKEYIVHDLYRKTRKVTIGFVGDIAIIESAKVCGLELVKGTKNALYTASYGLGELIQHAINQQAKTIMICLGGSATNDGGIGMLSALGVHFYDEHHRNVKPTLEGLHQIKSFDMTDFSIPKDVSIIGVCDVENMLCGDLGATFVYGPQKGLIKEELSYHDQAMNDYAKMIDHYLGQDYRYEKSTGAAGGLGYALLALCHGKLQKGVDVVSQISYLEEKIKDCDCVIVGEGKMDKQTQYGKTPYGVLQIAKKYHKPVYAFAGKIEDKEVLYQLGFARLYTITPEGMPLQQALNEGQENLKKCVKEHRKEILL